MKLETESESTTCCGCGNVCVSTWPTYGIAKLSGRDSTQKIIPHKRRLYSRFDVSLLMEDFPGGPSIRRMVVWCNTSIAGFIGCPYAGSDHWTSDMIRMWTSKGRLHHRSLHQIMTTWFTCNVTTFLWWFLLVIHWTSRGALFSVREINHSSKTRSQMIRWKTTVLRLGAGWSDLCAKFMWQHWVLFVFDRIWVVQKQNVTKWFIASRDTTAANLLILFCIAWIEDVLNASQCISMYLNVQCTYYL